MTFDKEDEYFFDREDSAWPVSQAELDEIWRERVKVRCTAFKNDG